MNRRSAARPPPRPRRQAQPGDRLDVQAPVRAQQLQRGERQRHLLGRRRWCREHSIPPSVGTQRNSSPPRARGRTRRSARPPAACPARRQARTRTSAPRGRAPCRRRAAGTRAAAARRPGTRTRAPPPPARPARPRYQAVAVDSSRSRSDSHAWPTLAWVITSNVRARAITSCSSANGSTAPPIRLRGRRTPFAIALSLPSCGVSSVSTRSASPSSKRDRTIASVW